MKCVLMLIEVRGVCYTSLSSIRQGTGIKNLWYENEVTLTGFV
jgi:hypothetical protein